VTAGRHGGTPGREMAGLVLRAELPHPTVQTAAFAGYDDLRFAVSRDGGPDPSRP
jgi:hypothetical protein